ncbi:MAG: LemA family protein [Magnetococcales bacterium]|nr:LemA family protein [Magnetococcales bacterium]
MSDKNDPMDEMDDLGLELTSSERMQRMRKLMRQLYQEEEATHATALPPIKSKSLILVSSISAIAFLVVTTFYNFNRFVAAEEQVLSSRGHIHDALQRRSNLFGNLVNLTLNHAMLEQEVFRYVSDGRLGMMGQTIPGTENGPHGPSGQAGQAGPPHPSEPSPKIGASQPFPAPATPMPGHGTPIDALSRLFGLVEQYPDIKTSTTYQQLMDKLVDIENMISMRRDEYNTEVKLYNTLITSFPWSVMARILGFERYQYFTAGTGPDNMNMDLDSRKFMRLIPEVELTNTHHKDGTKPEAGAVAPGPSTPEAGAVTPLPMVPGKTPAQTPLPMVPGKTPAQAGKVQPDSGKVQPDSGKVQPDSGKVQPDFGKVQPDSGKVQPDSGKVQPDSRKNQPDAGEKAVTKPAPDASKPEEGLRLPGQPPPSESKPEEAAPSSEPGMPTSQNPDTGADASPSPRIEPTGPDARKSMRLISENKLVAPQSKEASSSETGAVTPAQPVPSTDTLGNGEHENGPSKAAPAPNASKQEAGGKAAAVNASKATAKPAGTPPPAKTGDGATKATQGAAKPPAKPTHGNNNQASKVGNGTEQAADKLAVASARPVVSKSPELPAADAP